MAEESEVTYPAKGTFSNQEELEKILAKKGWTKFESNTWKIVGGPWVYEPLYDEDKGEFYLLRHTFEETGKCRKSRPLSFVCPLVKDAPSQVCMGVESLVSLVSFSFPLFSLVSLVFLTFLSCFLLFCFSLVPSCETFKRGSIHHPDMSKREFLEQQRQANIKG
uniref:Uncharacterized protein n=1 Tax=Paramoeba aestuarina TaxID=180227 RepID=A0A7S4JUV5_9EUKA